MVLTIISAVKGGNVNRLKAKGTIGFLKSIIFYGIILESFFIALSPMLAEIALLVGFVAYLIRWKLDDEYHYERLPFDIPVLIFVLFGAASIAVSPDKGFSFYNYYNLVGVYMMIYILVGQNIRKPDQVKTVAKTLGLSLALVVLYGFYQFIFGIDISDMKWVDGEQFPELRTRVFSTWENPNILAGYLDIAICVLLGLFLKADTSRMKWMLTGGMVLTAACLGMTYARGACLTIALILVGYGALRNRKLLLAALGVGVVILLLDSTLATRLMSVFTKIDTSSEMRLAFWEATIAMIMDHPFLGIGWGAYWMVYPNYDFYMEGEYIKIVHAHNVYLNYMAEIGIIGAAAFFVNFFGTMKIALSSKGRGSFVRDGLLLGIGLALVSVALNGLTDDVLFNIPSSMLFWFMCALAMVIEKRM